MVNIILELSLVNDLVDLLSNALNTAVLTNLTNDVLAVSALSELKILVKLISRIGNDVLNVEWA